MILELVGILVVCLIMMVAIVIHEIHRLNEKLDEMMPK